MTPGESDQRTSIAASEARARALREARRSRGYWTLFLAIAFSCVAGAASTRPGPQHKPAAEQPFTPEFVQQAARRAATSEYVVRRLDGPPALDALNYDQYRDIRFNSDMGVWRTEQTQFRVELLPAGFLFKAPVKVSIVESGKSHDQVGLPTMFNLGPSVAKQLANQPLPLSGFRVRTRLNSRSVWDEFLVYQGASYFRAVDKGGVYGLSARGLALRTAHPLGEEFPAFTHFWIERPAANATGIVVHALLDSPSTTGAYRFAVTPGAETIMDVEATLYPRVDLDHVGIAPLTSMFLFDESERTRVDDFRDEVHDSDGLLVVLASGERVWRPLRNPTQLQYSSFTNEAPKGFGLLQRSRRVSDYHDFEARYEDRPSAWIEPTSQWGQGSVDLVEIPTDSETNDNIVAYWRPKYTLTAGKAYRYTYRLRWNSQPKLTPALGKATATRTGPSFDGRRRIFVVEFTGAGRTIDGLKIDAGTSAGKLSNLVLQPNPLTKGVRASFELDPGDAELAELRLRLLRAEKPVSETWLYRWTAT